MMGYVPPRLILKSEVPLRAAMTAELQARWEEALRSNRPIVLGKGLGIERHSLPRTFAQYRSDLYGPRGRDWMPVLNAGVMATLATLVVLVMAVLSGWRM